MPVASQKNLIEEPISVLFNVNCKLLVLRSCCVAMLLIASQAYTQEQLPKKIIDQNDNSPLSQKMVDFKPSAQFDYGYITEREMEKIADKSDLDADMIRKAVLERQYNMHKAASLSLLDINDLLGTGSKTFKQSKIPHTHYLGSEVHLHLMHIDYAQVLMNYWDYIKSTTIPQNENQKLGQIQAEDVDFYNYNKYQNSCLDGRLGLCMSSFSPSFKGLYTINLYIKGIHNSLLINNYDVESNYQSLMAYKHQLQHIISHNLLDSSLVGVKEAQEREQRKAQKLDKGGFVASANVEVKKKPFTPEQIARIKEAARSSHSVVLEAHSEDKIDVMVSLDDLPYGYVDPYKKNVKQFKLEYILNQDNQDSGQEKSKTQ